MNESTQRTEVLDEAIAVLREAARSEHPNSSRTWEYAVLYLERMKENRDYLDFLRRLNDRRGLPAPETKAVA